MKAKYSLWCVDSGGDEPRFHVTETESEATSMAESLGSPARVRRCRLRRTPGAGAVDAAELDGYRSTIDHCETYPKSTAGTTPDELVGLGLWFVEPEPDPETPSFPCPVCTVLPPPDDCCGLCEGSRSVSVKTWAFHHAPLHDDAQWEKAIALCGELLDLCETLGAPQRLRPLLQQTPLGRAVLAWESMTVDRATARHRRSRFEGIAQHLGSSTADASNDASVDAREIAIPKSLCEEGSR